MHSGFEIDFYDPETPEVVLTGRLLPNVNKKHYIEFGGGGFSYLYKSYRVLFAVAKYSEEKYSLVNCRFRSYSNDLVRCEVTELYEGGHVKPVLYEEFISAEARLSYLSSWINHSRFQPHLTSDTNNPGTVTVKGPFLSTHFINDSCELEICQFCGEEFSSDQILLINRGYVKFNSSVPISRFELYKHVDAFIKLLSLFCKDIPILTHLEYVFSDSKLLSYVLPPYQDREEHQTEISLRFNEVEQYWHVIIERFYGNRDKYWQVLELYRESVQNTTPEISFLNLTTALELFHQYFLESGNKEIKKQLADELLLNGVIEGLRKEWVLVERYAHIFRLTQDIPFTTLLFPEIYTTLRMIRDTRNYYTHYKHIERSIWTPNQLYKINTHLRQLLKAAVLKELCLPDELINKSISTMADYVYYDDENNPYSIRYRK